MSADKSYARILRASSIMGASAGINMLLGMVRVKFAAILIGTTGVGLNASFVALQGVINTLAGLGIQSSAVREIAAALGKGEEQAIGRTVHTLRRICWFSGLLGMTGIMLLSPLLSQLTFGHREYSLDIAALGAAILFANLSGGQVALLQGARRIGDLARINVIGAALGTVAAIIWYALLGLRGIVPALVTVTAIQLALSWYFGRQVSVPRVTLTWQQTFAEARGMVNLGLVMMTNDLMGAAVTYFTITLITREVGIQAVGVYSAAFALSGMFINFVISAMSTDYYPRLTSVAPDKVAMRRMVNEQAEIGLLLALPGLLATIAFAPWILKIFYTNEFLDAVELLQWAILGCLGRVISWPLRFVLLSLGKGGCFLLTQTCFNFVHAGLIVLGLSLFGIEGVAIGFFIANIAYIALVNSICRHLINFNWSAGLLKISLISFLAIGSMFIVCRAMPNWLSTPTGSILVIVISMFSLRELILRLGPDSRIGRAIIRIPVLKHVLHSQNP